jgi:hypothetical protein
MATATTVSAGAGRGRLDQVRRTARTGWNRLGGQGPDLTVDLASDRDRVERVGRVGRRGHGALGGREAA